MKYVEEQGKMDFQNGVDYQNNPHPPNTREFVLWLEGWLSARNNHQTREEHSK
jgi:hypothetical protein